MGKSTSSPIICEISMNLTAIPFAIVDWSAVNPDKHIGKEGAAYWQTCHFGATRVRIVEYSPGYLASNWCWRGHVVLCLEGELHIELVDGRHFTLTPGMSYLVGPHMKGHRSFTVVGAKLFIVD